MFAEIDKDGDGYVNEQDMRLLLASIGLDDSEQRSALRRWLPASAVPVLPTACPPLPSRGCVVARAALARRCGRSSTWAR